MTMPKLANGTPDIATIRLQNFMALPGAVKWDGGEQPIQDGGRCEVLIKGNETLHITPTMILQPSGLNWTGALIRKSHGITQEPVQAFRIIEPAPTQPVDE